MNKLDMSAVSMAYGMAQKSAENLVRGAGAIQGKSAYAIAVENGFSGTETEWLASLKGEKGDKGDAGTNGTVSSMTDFEKFCENMHLDYAYDANTNANYTVMRIYKTKTDGSKQYPFVRTLDQNLSALELSENEDWFVIINAGLGVPGGARYDGVVIENGNIINNEPAVYHAGAQPLTIDVNGDLNYADADAKGHELLENGIVSATCGFCPIIINYTPVSSFPSVSNVSHFGQNAQRQIIGQFGNGDYAIITCEGRNFDHSDGWTLAEAQTICQKLGLKFAYNLDGGGSTETVLGKKQLNSIYENAKGRKIASFIVFNGKTTMDITPVAKTLVGLSANKEITNYTIGDSFDISDIVVNAVYSDGTTEDVTSNATIDASNINMSAEGQYLITISYTQSGKVVSTSISISVIGTEPDTPSVLPEGYTQLKYVSANGNQYINTEVNETQSVHAKYEVSISDMPAANGNHILSSANTFFPFLKANYGNADVHILGTKLKGGESITDGSMSYDWQFNTKYLIEGYIDGKIFINDIQCATVGAANYASASNMLYLFAYGGNVGNGTYRFHGNLYSCKMYNMDDQLIRDFVPCVNENGVAGLYDLVSQKFYHSDSGTELIAGTT